MELEYDRSMKNIILYVGEYNEMTTVSSIASLINRQSDRFYLLLWKPFSSFHSKCSEYVCGSQNVMYYHLLESILLGPAQLLPIPVAARSKA
jgi:hypothetical protein